MATRKTEPDTPEQPAAAVVQPQQYDAGTGWEVGQTAPEDAFRALDASGSGAPTGPVVHSHPGGYARLIVAKGGTVTEGVRRELDAAEEQPAAESDQG